MRASAVPAEGDDLLPVRGEIGQHGDHFEGLGDFQDDVAGEFRLHLLEEQRIGGGGGAGGGILHRRGEFRVLIPHAGEGGIGGAALSGGTDHGGHTIVEGSAARLGRGIRQTDHAANGPKYRGEPRRQRRGSRHSGCFR